MPQDNHNYPVEQCPLTLWRYPKQDVRSSLQAWDSADILLAETALPILTQTNASTLVVNDQFGAISLHLQSVTSAPISFYSDSKIAHLAYQQNLQLNSDNSAKTDLTITPLGSSLNDLNKITAEQVYLIKIPKNLDFLEAILDKIHQVAADDVQVIAAAKATEINNKVVKLFNRYFKQVDVGLAVKKSRTIRASGKQPSPYSSYSYWKTWQLDNGLTIYNAPNVFSRSSLDMGAAFFLPHLPAKPHDFQPTQTHVFDLACGNGILSAYIANSFRQNNCAGELVIHLFDESYMAIESAVKTLEENNLNNIKIKTCWNDCLADVEQKAHWIVCNPPFHQQKTITDHIAMQMFNQSKVCLAEGGKLSIVGNAHLGYGKRLNEIFGSSQLVAQDKRFVVLKANG
ncbi:methyltransferase [Catenovulum sp. SX2]|uniref:methyltransferase n=1 Tax=Catenovulum sp. SX2 TaxID=3398614 RepID=UPI003F82D46A